MLNSINLIIILSLLSILPLIAVVCTSFLKISVVLLFMRESLSLQQIPPNIVIYGMAIILSVYTMGPVCNTVINQINNLQYIDAQQKEADLTGELATIKEPKFSDTINHVTTPLRQFLTDNSTSDNRTFFYESLKKLWKQPYVNNVEKTDMIILIPSFMITQLNDAFKIGFLLYLPSLIIDIFISNLLLALGMMMMSPMTLSTPIKLLLFILIGGWDKVINLLLRSFIV